MMRYQKIKKIQKKRMDKIRSSSNNSSVINIETEIQNMLGKRKEKKEN